MSWPADGAPRYVTGWIQGGHILPGLPGGNQYPEAYVYDRASCCKIVWRLSGELLRMVSLAEIRAAEMNARWEEERASRAA